MTLTISEATCALPKILSMNWREKALRSPAQVSTSILLSGEDFRTVQELSGGVARITTEALARQRVEQSSRGVASG